MTEWESAKSTYLSMLLEEKRNEYRCGSHFKTIDDLLNWRAYALTYEAKKLGVCSNSDNANILKDDEINEKISVLIGDITCLELDAIVNAANSSLAGGGGVDGAIHSAAGTGHAKITGGYKLPAKYVIHTVGPMSEIPDLLQSCYKNSLDLLKENGLRTIAFPCISTGVYGYPNEAAADVALKSVREWLDSNEYKLNIKRIVFCLFLDVDVKAYHKLLPKYFPVK